VHSTSKLFGPVKANEAKSYAYFLRAANLGLACAQHNVGVALMPGAGSIEPELWKAIEYWKMAAEQGFHLSLINLGKIYMQGMECKGFKVERDLVQARGLFERIVEDGKVEGGVDEAYVGQAREFLEILDQMEE
jgi:TPR repeat protein